MLLLWVVAAHTANADITGKYCSGEEPKNELILREAKDRFLVVNVPIPQCCQLIHVVMVAIAAVKLAELLIINLIPNIKHELLLLLLRSE